MIQISDGDERHSIESKLWSVEDELRRCHASPKTRSQSEGRRNNLDDIRHVILQMLEHLSHAE